MDKATTEKMREMRKKLREMVAERERANKKLTDRELIKFSRQYDALVVETMREQKRQAESGSKKDK